MHKEMFAKKKIEKNNYSRREKKLIPICARIGEEKLENLN
jgi:hypothetical protein